VTHEFHISVTHVGGMQYLVRTERVAPGVPLAQELLEWAIEDWLAQARQFMSPPLLSLLQGHDGQGRDGAFESPIAWSDQASRSLMDLRKQLYDAIFHGTLRDSWVIAQGVALSKNQALRLRLGLSSKDPQLHRLPWEVLYSNDVPGGFSGQLGQQSQPFATGDHVIFSRYQLLSPLMGEGDSLAIEPDQPLRILVVISAPTDQERLQLQQEVHQLQQELQTQTAHGLPSFELTILRQPDREQLTHALEQGQFHVLHYAGHSDLGSAGGSLYLVNQRTGLTEFLNGHDLAGLLVNNGVRLAVFNSCRGAHTAADPKGTDPKGDRDRNLAEAMVNRGIPAVLAMAEQIPDNVARTLTWLFYRNLKQGYPIDLSLSRARQGLISSFGSSELYWALPILYQHSEFDGYLTAGDRTHDNPADRWVMQPQIAQPTLAGEPDPAEVPLEPESDEEEMVWKAVIEEEDDFGDWADDLEYPEESDEEDAEVVADLLSQVTQASQSRWQGAADPAITISRLTPNPTSSAVSNPQAPPLATPPGTGIAHPPISTPQTPSRSPGDRPPQPTDATSITRIERQGIVSQNAQDMAPPEDAVQILTPPVQHIPIEALQPARQGAGPARPTRPLSAERKALLPVLGAGGALVVALLGYWLVPQVQWNSFLSKIPNPVTSLGATQDLQGKETKEVAAIASDRFTKGRLAEGEQALGLLLDRGALVEATAILQAIPSEAAAQPGISYLRGRLAWQSMHTGNPDYLISDAIRDWESAAQAQPESATYRTALGFAYYAQSKPREALQAWGEAKNILESSQNSSPTPDLDKLTIYAGMALALRQSANDPLQPQGDLASKATKTYQFVITSDPVNFQPQALSKNWLWSESAIKDWLALAKES
jgi:hypothetical protein